MCPPQYGLFDSPTSDSDASHYGYDLSAHSSSSESNASNRLLTPHGPHGLGCSCHGSVTGDKRTDDDTDADQDRQQLDFYQGISGLLLSTEHPQDLKIKVGKSIFPAHRCIISIRTEYFSSALAASDTATDTVTIEGHSVCTVWWFLQWCYMGRYYVDEPIGWNGVECITVPEMGSMESEYTGAERHVRIYHLANHLQCPELEEHASDEYRKFWLQAENWDRMSFLQSAREIFEKPISADGRLCCLRESVTSVARHFNRLLKKMDGDGEEYEKLLKEVPGFAGELIWGHS